MIKSKILAALRSVSIHPPAKCQTICFASYLIHHVLYSKAQNVCENMLHTDKHTHTPNWVIFVNDQSAAQYAINFIIIFSPTAYRQTCMRDASAELTDQFIIIYRQINYLFMCCVSASSATASRVW